MVNDAMRRLGQLDKATDKSMFRRASVLALVSAGALLVGFGCGAVTDARVQARDSAAQATCMRYQACQDIGPGLTYADYNSCLTVWQGNWENDWPASTCQGKIDQAKLSVCLDAIGATACTGFDFVLTLGKCSAANVCDLGAPPDAATD
jgi:Family of unknown function (DUF6184)